jgi:uncharacterized flavoprotein (TIGR03862 family)
VAAPPVAAIVGGGPAGLMAAEALAGSGIAVHVFDAMPSAGRKFLMAGKSGLNLTHAEDFAAFLGRFGPFRRRLEPFLAAFGPDAVRAWAEGLGVATFVGSSGRVFPTDFKAAPLLRAWLRRLREAGIRFHMRHRFLGWTAQGAVEFATPAGTLPFAADAVILALGGASWPRLGSDAAWIPVLRRDGVEVAPMRPANCGFDVAWSAHFRERFAGQPVKSVALAAEGRRTRGEFVVTESGIEGGGVYVHAAALRDRIAAAGKAVLTLDLAPDRGEGELRRLLGTPRGSRSLADHLRRRAGIAGVKAGLLREHLAPADLADPARAAAAIKALPLRLVAPRPIEEAISSAGGIAFDALDERLMVQARPGVFCAGEMLDWEVETGGYLLTACLALGRAAGLGAASWLGEARAPPALRHFVRPA